MNASSSSEFPPTDLKPSSSRTLTRDEPSVPGKGAWPSGPYPDAIEALTTNPHRRDDKAFVLDVAYEEFLGRKFAGEVFDADAAVMAGAGAKGNAFATAGTGGRERTPAAAAVVSLRGPAVDVAAGEADVSIQSQRVALPRDVDERPAVFAHRRAAVDLGSAPGAAKQPARRLVSGEALGVGHRAC